MADELAGVSVDDVRAWVKGKSKDEIAAAIRELPPEALLAAGQKALAQLGTYSARLVKQERVGGKLEPAQTLKLLLREDPLAVRIDFVEGPAKGRKVLFDSSTRPKEMRVKEPGMLGMVGALWLNLDNGLARRDTNHRVTDLGLGALLRLMKKDVEGSRPHGGLIRRDEGFDARGRYCVVYTAPPNARGLYAQKTRVCFDVETLLPMEVQVHDRHGLLETFAWSEIAPASADEKTFSLEAAGL